jgi:hypothetical protein
MRIERNNKTHVTHYDSFAEFLAHVGSDVAGPATSRSTSNAGWSGTPTFEEAMRLAREGWPEGLEMIQRLTTRLEHITSDLVAKPIVQWDVAGDFADAGLYATGVPECMGFFAEAEPTKGSGKIVKIRLNSSVSGGVGTGTIMRRGAVACALIDALESAGRSCEVEIASSTHDGWKVATTVPIKSAGEPLELDRMAYNLAHPSSFRRLMFSAWEHLPDEIRHANGYFGGTYGMPTSYTGGQCDIDVPHMSLREYPDDASLLAWIKEQLIAQGCEIDEPATT